MPGDKKFVNVQFPSECQNALTYCFYKSKTILNNKWKMSSLTSVNTEIIFNSVISYAFKLFQEIWKQGYLSHVGSTFARSLNIRTLESSFSAALEVMTLRAQSSFILQTLWPLYVPFHLSLCTASLSKSLLKSPKAGCSHGTDLETIFRAYYPNSLSAFMGKSLRHFSVLVL